VTIALQGNGSANSDSISIPSHAAGDLIVIHSMNHASSTVPTKPSGWVTSYSAGVAGGAVLVAHKHAQSNAETSGTWANADHLFVTVWRGGTNTIVVPEFVSTNSATTVTVNYGAQVAGSVKTDAANAALLAYVLNSNTANTLLPPGATTDLQSATDSSTWQAKQYYQLNRTAVWASTNVSQANSAFYRSLMLTLIESYIYGISSGGIFFRPGMSGGLD
jgi:hypothetical protein